MAFDRIDTLRVMAGAATCLMVMNPAAHHVNAQEVSPIKTSLGSSDAQHQTDFRVKLGSVSLGNMTFSIATSGNNYNFSGKGRTSGIADWFAPGKATLKSEGQVSGSSITATSHFLSVTEGKETSTLKMSFENGNAADVSVVPDKRKKKKPKKYVMFSSGDLENVVDPASTMVVPVPLESAKNPNAVCGHTFRVYDGDTRFDIRLSYKRNAPISTKGYDGNAYVCKLKYVPVSGHRRKHKSTERMASNNDMEIWLAPISGGGPNQAIFTAIRIDIPTWLGTFTAEPEYFGPSRS